MTDRVISDKRYLTSHNCAVQLDLRGCVEENMAVMTRCRHTARKKFNPSVGH